MDRVERDPPGLFRHPRLKRVVIVHGDMKLVFIAGQTPTDDNSVSSGHYKAHYIQVMNNLDIALRNPGESWDEVVYRRMSLVDADAFARIFFDEDIPA